MEGQFNSSIGHNTSAGTESLHARPSERIQALASGEIFFVSNPYPLLNLQDLIFSLGLNT